MAASGWSGRGLDRITEGLEKCAGMDFFPLMERWEDIITEGNRRGVLAGRDGNDQPMPPLKYRGGAGKRTANRRVPQYGTTTHYPGLDGLTSSQYKALTGPRLAPRGEDSRSIKNFFTTIRRPGPDLWDVVGGWLEVVSAKGVPFLPFHFNGAGHNPRYDLRPVRPADRQFCQNALRAYVAEQMRKAFP